MIKYTAWRGPARQLPKDNGWNDYLDMYQEYVDERNAGGPMLVLDNMIRHVRVMCPDGKIRVIAKDDIETITPETGVPEGLIREAQDAGEGE